MGPTVRQRDDPSGCERHPEQVDPPARAAHRDRQRAQELDAHRDSQRDPMNRAVEAQVHPGQDQPEHAGEQELTS
jgi:hypothetical protein